MSCKTCYGVGLIGGTSLEDQEKRFCPDCFPASTAASEQANEFAHIAALSKATTWPYDPIYQLWNTGSGGWDDMTKAHFDDAPESYRRIVYSPAASEQQASVSEDYVALELARRWKERAEKVEAALSGRATIPSEADERMASTLLQSHGDHTARFLYAAPNTATTAAVQQGDTARADENEALRQEVIIMYQLLDDGEWAEHIAGTPHGQCLETAITKLIGKAQQGAVQAQAGDVARDVVIAEAAAVFESAAKHNHEKGRTVFAHAQQDRADRLHAAMAAPATSKGNS